MKLIEVHLSLRVLPFLFLCTCGCVFASPNQDRVYWNWTKTYKKETLAFKIQPDEAAKLVMAEVAKMDSKDPRTYIAVQPTFIVGRWYCFDRPAKASAELAGFYVDGDTGKVEYRESNVVLEPSMLGFSNKLPKNAWTKITPLSSK